MDLRIRKAERRDAGAIVLLTEELGYHLTEKEIKNKLKKKSQDAEQAVFVAEEDIVIGWMHIALTETLESSSFVEIRGLVVTEEHPGKGAGTKLIRTAMRWARGKGCYRIRIRTNITRKKTREYYRHLGFISMKTQEVFEKKI